MKILIYPKNDNPYLEKLYSQMTGENKITYYNFQIHHRKNIPFFVPLIFSRLKGYQVFHLHWLYPFKSPINNKFFVMLFSINFIFSIILIKLLRFKLIWTVHNVLPHEKTFFNDLLMTRLLSKLSNHKIIHSESTLKEMKKYSIDTKNTHVIPIGPYLNIYKSNISRNEARKKLGINDKDFVFLFFGMIRPYKGIDLLVSSFRKLSRYNKSTMLIVAGDCKSNKIRNELKQVKIELEDKLLLNLDYINDADVQTYFNSADVFVAPFKKITTSSSVNLAMAFRKPVICPRIGEFKDMPSDIAFFYDPKDDDALYHEMIQLITRSSELDEKAKAGFQYIKSLSWKNSANLTQKVYYAKN